jgi:hypothetical protein
VFVKLFLESKHFRLLGLLIGVVLDVGKEKFPGVFCGKIVGGNLF